MSRLATPAATAPLPVICAWCYAPYRAGMREERCWGATDGRYHVPIVVRFEEYREEEA